MPLHSVEEAIPAARTDGKSSGGGCGSVELPKTFRAIEQIKSHGGLNENGWAQIDKELAEQLLLRATRILTPGTKDINRYACNYERKA